MFNSAVAEHLRWYVYALRNPLDGRIFYIGKGKGNRVFQHAVAAEGSLRGEEVSGKVELILWRSSPAAKKWRLSSSGMA